MMANSPYAGFAEDKRAAQDHGIELYPLERPSQCTKGKCQQPAIVNGAWLWPEGTGRWYCDNYCRGCLDRLLERGPVIR